MIEEEFEDECFIDELSPDKFFSEDKLLTLDDTKSYESFIKNELEKINQHNQLIYKNMKKFSTNFKYEILMEPGPFFQSIMMKLNQSCLYLKKLNT